MESPDRPLTLNEVAEHLGFHYNTVYRWVRSGRLPATRRNGEWEVLPADVRTAVDGGDARRGRRGRPSWEARRARLIERLLAGDGEGAWAIVDEARSSGGDAEPITLELLVPAMSQIGEAWADGRIGVEDEHRASAVMLRVLGRLSPAFNRRGRTKGAVLVGGAPGDGHGLAVAFVAELLRGRNLEVVDLGGDVPADSWHRTANSAGPWRAIVMVSAVTTDAGFLRGIVDGLRADVPDVPILVGGAAVVDEATATALGSDRYVPDLGDLLVQVGG